MTAANLPIGAVAAPVISEESRARGEALQRYLDEREAGVRVAGCARLSGGYETYIYEVRFEAAEGATPVLPVDRPLILRIYHGPDVVARSGWENAVIARVRQDGIPAPEVFLYEPSLAPLGGSFLLLEFMRGKRMDEAALNAGPVAVIRMIRAFARAQAAVYRVQWPEAQAEARAPAAAGELGPLAWSGDRLGAARREIMARNLQPLLPIVDWLEENRRIVAGEPEVLIHGDFHPL
ncbi:MAG TPA: phosphotransferase, partial [Dehalococcoidia bacterium]|nr:phosphotransferase [Dehalococcoidia bacterium]